MDGAFTRVALSTGGATIQGMSEVEAVALRGEEQRVVRASDAGCLALILGEVRHIFLIKTMLF
jgi:hypothetical protein